MRILDSQLQMEIWTIMKKEGGLSYPSVQKQTGILSGNFTKFFYFLVATGMIELEFDKKLKLHPLTEKGRAFEPNNSGLVQAAA
jgi:hypothetical protein